MEIDKELVRWFVWKVFGRSIHGIEALPILIGPLKGRALPKQSALEQLSMLFGRYEPAVISEVLQLSETTIVVYDVGANIGYITLALAHSIKDHGKVFAFEPLPGNVEIIKKLITINNLEKMVEVLPLALGDKTEKQKFVMWGSSAMHLLESASNGHDTSCCTSIMVDSATLDSFVFECKNPPPHLIKIDVEGAETLVLKGALRTLETYSPAILAEIHGPTNAARVWDALDTLDYKWLKLTPRGRSTCATSETLVSYFTKDAWTHHFLITR
jgi:FkbM family methyltransferase